MNSLIISAQKGEKEAFQNLITFYYPYVAKFGYCLAVSHDISRRIFLSGLASHKKEHFYIYILPITPFLVSWHREQYYNSCLELLL